MELPEPLQCVDLDLAHAFAGQPEPPSDLLERLRVAVIEAEAQDQDRSLTVRQRTERERERLRAKRFLDLLVRERALAGDEVPEHGVVGLADGGVEGGGGARCRPDLLGLGERQICLLGDLGSGRLPAESRPEVPLGPVQLLQAFHDVHGHPNHPCLVGECPRNGLADPPGGVRGELVPPAPVELLDGADESECSFLDQVEER